MTEIEDTAENDESNEDEMPESERHVLAAVVALDELSDSDLAGVIVGELWARRAKAQPGLLDAAYTAINAVLGAELTDHQAALLPRLADVGRGVTKLQSAQDDVAPLVREIAPWVRRALVMKFSKPTRKARMLGDALEARFGRSVDKARLVEALTKKNLSLNGRVTRVAMAAGILMGDVGDETDRRRALGTVRDALKRV